MRPDKRSPSRVALVARRRRLDGRVRGLRAWKENCDCSLAIYILLCHGRLRLNYPEPHINRDSLLAIWSNYNNSVSPISLEYDTSQYRFHKSASWYDMLFFGKNTSHIQKICSVQAQRATQASDEHAKSTTIQATMRAVCYIAITKSGRTIRKWVPCKWKSRFFTPCFALIVPPQK